MIDLDYGSFDAEITKAARPVLVDFWAEWCAPCKSLDPVLEELSTEFGGRVIMARVNVDEYPRIAAGLGIRSIPAVVVFSGGEEKERLIGTHSKVAIKRKIESVLI